MKQLLSALLLGLIISYSFSTKKNNGVEKETSNYPSANKSVRKQSQTSNKSAETPADGQYRFDIAFAEWEGKSMGEKVSIVIKRVRKLTLTEAGEVLTLGILKGINRESGLSRNPRQTARLKKLEAVQVILPLSTLKRWNFGCAKE